MEILLPLLFSGILIFLRQKVPIKDYPNATVYESYAVDVLPSRLMHHLQLAYVPRNSSVVRKVAEDVRGSLFLSSGGCWWLVRRLDSVYLFFFPLYFLSIRTGNPEDKIAPSNCWNPHV